MLQNQLLANYRILDLTRILAGPFCTMLLSDLGAQVVKIEEPLKGDPTRAWGPPFYDVGDGASLYYHAFNRGKLSVGLDFRTPAGQGILHELAKSSDIFVENFIPGGLKRYHLDYEFLHKLNPDLIYCSISGYGQRGPRASMPGYDLVVSSFAGLVSITGPYEAPLVESDGQQQSRSEPCRVGVAITDLSTGLIAQSAILAALVPRRGAPSVYRGCHIDVNLMSTQVAVNSHVAANYLTAGDNPRRLGTSHPNLVPYRGYKTGDNKFLIVGTGSDENFYTLCRVLGRPEWINDERFAKNAARVQHRLLVDELVQVELSKQPLVHWLKQFATTNLPHGPINEMHQVFSEPQIKYYSDRLIQSWKATELAASSEAPRLSQAPQLCVPGHPVEFSFGDKSLGDISPPTAAQFHPTPPPRLGQHTHHVLRDVLHFSDEHINSLANDKIIRVASP